MEDGYFDSHGPGDLDHLLKPFYYVLSVLLEKNAYY